MAYKDGEEVWDPETFSWVSKKFKVPVAESTEGDDCSLEFQLAQDLYKQAGLLRGFDLSEFPDISKASPNDDSWLADSKFATVGEINESLKAAIAAHNNIQGTVDAVKTDIPFPNKDSFIGSARDYLKALRNAQKDLYKAAKRDMKLSGGDQQFGLSKEEKSSLKDLRKANRRAFQLEKAGSLEYQEWKSAAMGSAAQTAGSILNIGSLTAGNLFLSNKNFSKASNALDTGVHLASNELSLFGPYGVLAAGALETFNFVSKAGGSTVPGFDVDINSDSYGQSLSHYDALANRNWLAALTGGLTGTLDFNKSKIDNQLARRNEAAELAIKAKSIADDQHEESLATNHSVQDVVNQNNIALNGGVDTSVLAAKHGAVLNKLAAFKWRDVSRKQLDVLSEIIIAQNGAKLEKIEVSDEKSVIPEGALHKNKHEDFELDVTPKGIPVITVKDDSADTLAEIQMLADTVVQHAEIEHNEVIFSKELTDFIEENRKKWHESDESDKEICLKVGLRLTKELLENTDDNTGLIDKIDRLI